MKSLILRSFASIVLVALVPAIAQSRDIFSSSDCLRCGLFYVATAEPHEAKSPPNSLGKRIQVKAPASVAPAARQGTGLLVLGDSISAAYGIDKSKGWVALLEKALEVDCPGFTVQNASLSGETTAGGVTRLPGLLARWQPRIVVIELGGNDGLRGLSPGQMERNLVTMVRATRAAGAEPVVLGILIPPNYGEAYSKLFEQAMRRAIAAEQVPFLDFFLSGIATNDALMQADGLHPTAAAQPTLLANAWQVLAEPLGKLCPGLDLAGIGN